MITEIDIHEIIISAKNEVSHLNEIEASPGKIHHHLSKAFVAYVGRFLKKCYNAEEYEVKFQDYIDGRGVRGEWLFDAVVVKNRIIAEDKIEIKYPFQIDTVVESEMAAGIEALKADFPKLLVVNAKHKIYINGIEANDKKDEYIAKRYNIIKAIIEKQEDHSDYTICFVDHPRYWKNEHIIVKVYNIGGFTSDNPELP
jgi:hypothetical protein